MQSTYKARPGYFFTVGVRDDPRGPESFNLLEKGGGTPAFARKQSQSVDNFRYEVCFENITSQASQRFSLFQTFNF